MRTFRTILKKHYFRKAVIYLVTYCLLFNTTIVWALDEGNLDSATGLNSASWGNDTVLNTANGAILNWNNFDTSAVQSVTFNQPDIDASVLNRISGAATQFDGSLISNGNVFIVNPAGVYFGANSSVNVNQLIASSLDILNFDIENPDFLAGKYQFTAAQGATGGIVNNSQNMNAVKGIALLGKYVTNNGKITTGAGGFVVMAAGDKVFLGEPDGNIIIEMKSVTPVGADDGKVINNGTITAREGKVALASGDVTAPAETSAYGAGDIYTTAIDLPKVSGGIGTVQQNGTINTNGLTGDGGEIGMTANDSVTLGSGSTTTANAGSGGDAGLVVVHSKGQTTIQNGASIQAIGGHEPFNLEGEFDDIVDTTVEITGEQVTLAGNINASATGTKRGKIIIDAFDMTVANGSKPTNPLINTVYEKWIEAQSDVATDVELVAHSKEAGNITVEHLTDGVIFGGSGDIVMRTKYNTGGIFFEAGAGQDPASIVTDNGGNVYMLAGKGGISIGDVTTYLDQHDPGEPGKIRISTTDGDGGNITTGSLSVEGGSYDEISVVAKGNLIVNGDISTYAHQVDEALRVYQARTCLVSDLGDVTVNGTISLYTQGKYGTTADLHIDAGHDVVLNPGARQITVEAKTVTSGPSNASVRIHAGQQTDPENPEDVGIITVNGVSYENLGNVIDLKAQAGGGVGTAEVSSADDPATWNEEVGAVYDDDGNLLQGAHAKLEIDDKHTEQCNECPVPPGLTPPIDPVGTPDTGSTHMGDTTSGNVLDNDDPEPGRTLTVISNTDPEHGTVTVMSNGDYVYTPDEGYVGEDSFTYIAYDGESSTDPITVTITMWNNAPTPQGDTGSTHMGTSVTFNIADLLSNDTDPDSDAISYDSFNYTGSGTVVDNGDGTLTYTPAAGYVGNDSFTYTVTDPQIGGTPQATTVTITMNNNPPTPVGDTGSTHMGTSVTINIADLLSNDTDPDSDAVFFNNFTYTGSGLLVNNGDGTLTYTPIDGYVGSDTFTYTVTDPQIGGTPQAATVTIFVGNNPPQPGNDTYTTNFGSEFSGNVLANDTDPDIQDTLSVVLDGVSPQHGTLVLNPDGTFTYTPEPGYTGEDSFAYLLTDGQLDGQLPVGTVRIIINPFVVAAPLPVLEEMDISGCPALIQWTAQEIGSNSQAAQIWVTNTLASPRDIQPCEACSNLREASLVLSDRTYVDAISRIVNGIVPTDAPISEEQMASITTALAGNAQANTDLAYAKEYISNLQNYVDILNRNLELNMDDSVMVAVDNYIAPLAQENTNMAVYLTAMLTNP